MASSTATSTLTLCCYAQELNNSSLPSSSSFYLTKKPLFFTSPKTSSLYPLVLKCREKNSSNWVTSGSGSSSFIVAAAAAAVATEDELDEEEWDDGYEKKGPAITPRTRPRTGKQALPLKRDRSRSKRFLEIQQLRENKKEYDVNIGIKWDKGERQKIPLKHLISGLEQ